MHELESSKGCPDPGSRAPAALGAGRSKKQDQGPMHCGCKNGADAE